MIFFTLFRMPFTACHYVAQEPSNKGGLSIGPHQVVENLEAQEVPGSTK